MKRLPYRRLNPTGYFLGLLTFTAAVFVLLASPSRAQQLESTANCDEAGVPPIAEPVSMVYGDSTAGCLIDPATESDSFVFNAEAGDVAKIVVLGQTGNFGPSIVLRDPMGGVILNGDVDSASCQPPFNSICSFSVNTPPLTLGGTYSIVLSDRGGNNIGSYTMQLERLFPSPSSNRLNHDGLAVFNDRVTDVINDSSASDSISPATDIDQYHFSGVTNTLLRINALGLSGNFGPEIEVRDPNGDLVLDGLADGAGCQPNFNSICSFSVDLVPLITGSYSLLLKDRGHNNPGSYQLSLWCITGDCDSDGDGVADIFRTALRYGESAKSPSISPAVNGDFYVFNATPGDEIRFTALGQSGNFGPEIEVRDPTGTVVLNGSNDGAGCQPNFNSVCSFTVDLMPAMMGAYTVFLHDRGVNNAGNYAFTLECLFSPGDFRCENLPGSFPGDVPEDYWAFNFIETLALRGITVGCGAGPDTYCPLDPVTRAQMAVFIERGINGANFRPPPANGTAFNDVTVGGFAAEFIEQFSRDGITAGCGNGNYCPHDSVSRAQMAVFLLRAEHGSGFSPPNATGVFQDVPFDHWAAPWIEQLAAEGITSGCGADTYCPDDPVTRDQMAVFLVRTFGLDD